MWSYIVSNEKPNYYRERDLTRGIVPFSAATLWRRVREGQFPAPTKFGGITAWKASDVHKWLDAHHQRMEQKSQGVQS
jgi:predicted DNA-binding transcriptional regulator AlpA